MKCPEQGLPEELENGCKFSIVIVDDNPGSLEYLSTALAGTGVDIFPAPSGEEALALVYSHHPQIVLSDLVMPTLNGLDVLRMVKEFDPTISVVIMSSDSPGCDTARAMDEAGSDYLRKPIPPAELRNCIGRLLKRHLEQSV
jgi:CheY-like chemotaxis protein